jgi:hypothetical protein
MTTGQDTHCELYRQVFPNGKFYIGIARDTATRWIGHQRKSQGGSRLAVHNAIRKYGVENVRVEVLAVGSLAYILDMETRAIAVFKTVDRRFGYNLHLGGTTSPMANPEIAAKVSRSKKGVFTEKMAAALSQTLPKLFTPEANANRAVALRAFWAHMTPEEYAEACRSRSGRLAWNKGRKATAAECEAVRIAAQNRGPEWLINVTAANRLRKGQCDERHAAQLASARARVDQAARIAKISATCSNSVWITNDITGRRIAPNDPLPDGWRYGKRHQAVTPEDGRSDSCVG